MKKDYFITVFVIGLCFTTAVLVLMAAKTALFDLEENGCEMTYMFEYPEYIRIKLKKKLSKIYPRYGLYLYGEGDYAQELRRSKPNGIPVLFIPGNAGSYRQVRSLASVALRKAESHKTHFNYFTIDFDEDLSGLYGGVLMDQVNFVHSCVRHIIRMYQGNTFAPESVIVIGHSMGGMIARALFTLDSFQSKFVSFIITLGTPHAQPVIPFDSHLNSFYLKVNNFWRNSPTVMNISIISLAGGARDILVPARYCSITRDIYTDLQYGAVTTAVPDIWLTIDHLALCWCKQLILVINRALFALFDKDTNTITKDAMQRERVLRKYFGIIYEQNEGTLSKSKIHQSPRVYNATNLWNHFGEIIVAGTLFIPVDTSRDDVQFIALSNSSGGISIRCCKGIDVDMCTGSSITAFQTIPSPKEKVGFFHLAKLTNTSYIKMSSLKDKSRLAMQFVSRSDVNKRLDKAQIFSVFSSQKFMSSNSMFLNISLPMIRNSFDVFLITVNKVNCENDRDGLFTGRIHIPWSQEDLYAKPAQSTEFSILSKTHVSKPTAVSKPAQLHIWKTDQCSVEVSVEYQFTQTLGRIFILYTPLLPQWVYFWIMIVLVIQLKEMSNEGIWLSIWSTVTSFQLLRVIPLFILFSNDFFTKSFKSSLGWSGSDVISQLCASDIFILYDWLLPSSFIILTAFVIFLAISLTLEIILSSFARLFLLCSSKRVEPQSQTSTTVTVLFYSFLGLVLLVLVSVCSSVALYFMTMVSFVHGCKTTTKCRQLSTPKLSTSGRFEVVNKLNFCKLRLVLFLVVAFQTTPAFIVWLKVLPKSWHLPSDPFATLVLLHIPTLVCVFEMHVCKPPTYASYIVLAMWCVVYLFFSLDRLPYITGFILLTVDFFVLARYNKHEKNC